MHWFNEDQIDTKFIAYAKEGLGQHTSYFNLQQCMCATYIYYLGVQDNPTFVNNNTNQICRVTWVCTTTWCMFIGCFRLTFVNVLASFTSAHIQSLMCNRQFVLKMYIWYYSLDIHPLCFWLPGGWKCNLQQRFFAQKLWRVIV